MKATQNPNDTRHLFNLTLPLSPQSRSSQKSGTDIRLDNKDSTADESQSLEAIEQLPEGERDNTGTVIVKPKLSGYERRRGVKSDQAGRLEDSFDGGQDSDTTAMSSGEGQPLLQGLVI